MVFSLLGQAVAGDYGIITYQVQKGDTFSGLEQRFGSIPANVKALNSLKRDYLLAGETLYLPVILEGQSYVYQVQKGDTFYLIGQRVNRDYSSLQQVNEVNAVNLQVGQKILIPQVRDGFRAYRVLPGDTIEAIAEKYGVSVQDIIAVNHLPKNNLFSGQILEIPQRTSPTLPSRSNTSNNQLPADNSNLVVYRVQQGDNLDTIAKKYQTTASVLYQTNRLNSDILMPGQPLYVPVGSKQPVAVDGPKGTIKPGYGEFLEWDWARWVFNVGSVGTVTDFYTKQTFKVKYMGGSNHADVETLTSADTKVMKQVFGGEWTWKNRPILLKVGNRVLAASLAGYPHSIDTIDNGVTGHFDLYFYNSRTHNTNQIVQSHQDNVLTAAGLAGSN